MSDVDVVSVPSASRGGITREPPCPEYPNLRPRPPWRKGESGNPSGRPKGLFPSRARRKLREVVGKDENGEAILAVDELVEANFENAKKPDMAGVKSLELLLEWTHGPLAKVTESASAVAAVSVQLPDWYLQDQLHPELIKP
jgi:hypothetical protein